MTPAQAVVAQAYDNVGAVLHEELPHLKPKKLRRLAARTTQVALTQLLEQLRAGQIG